MLLTKKHSAFLSASLVLLLATSSTTKASAQNDEPNAWKTTAYTHAFGKNAGSIEIIGSVSDTVSVSGKATGSEKPSGDKTTGSGKVPASGKAVRSFKTNGEFTSVQAMISQPDSNRLKFSVRILNPDEQRFTIYIRSKALGTLLAKTMKDYEYANLYDMSQLEDGDYSIEIMVGKDSFRKDIRINTVTQINRIASIE